MFPTAPKRPQKFECSERERKLIQRLRALEALGFDELRIRLRPLAILEKIVTRPELIELPPAPFPPPPALPGHA